jgi:hypothetical protein
MGIVKKVTGKNFPRNHEGQRHDQPGKKLANPGADFVNKKQQVLHK